MPRPIFMWRCYVFSSSNMLSWFFFVVSWNMVGFFFFLYFYKMQSEVYIYEQNLGNPRYLSQKSGKGTKRTNEHFSESDPEESHTLGRVSSSGFCGGLPWGRSPVKCIFESFLQLEFSRFHLYSLINFNNNQKTEKVFNQWWSGPDVTLPNVKRLAFPHSFCILKVSTKNLRLHENTKSRPKSFNLQLGKPHWFPSQNLMLCNQNPETLAAEKAGRPYIYPQTTDFLVLYSKIIRN